MPFTNASPFDQVGSREALVRLTHLLTNKVSTLHVTPKFTPTFSGTETLTGDPRLDADYRLRAGSAAIDTGTPSAATDDIDGQHRPIGLPDIGAEEWQLTVFVPLVLRDPP